jgi:membrane-bound ClpP family serine protease
MSTLVVTLFVVGLIFLGFEVIVPGAIMGIAAGCFLLGGVIVAWIEHGPDGGLLALGVAIFAVAALLYFELRILPRTRIGRRMFLNKAVEGASQPPIVERAADVVGREAVAVTALAPTGLVQVDGRRYEARCDSGFAVEGARLRVVRVETFQLVVIASS